MRSSMLIAAAILLLVAGCAAEQQPAHYFGRGGKSGGTGKGSKGSSAIAGVWRAEQPGEASPLAYITAIVQGDAVAITGVFTSDNSAITGTGWFVSPPRPSYKVDTYPTYKVYFGATALAGWWTLVAIDADTVLPYAGENPEIPSPPVQAPGQPVFKRVNY